MQKPIVMRPAYRYGAMTPWGGSKLKTVFGKSIPDERTGEALEISAISGLESRAEDGRTLTEILSGGEEIWGSKVKPPFPLLLKFIDARDDLSVQVHPSDEYSGRVEGKLGKTEAWHILACDEGAQLVYGILPGITKEQLKEASYAGAEIEKYLRRVTVHAGETYFIPAGMVHAIGKGILLYEIQQSSDVTYRFYDYGRKDKNGNERELHREEALDVTDLSLTLDAVKPIKHEISGGSEETLIDCDIFTLTRLDIDGSVKLAESPEAFRFLSMLSDMTLSGEDYREALKAGTSVFIPAGCGRLALSGKGFALISRPTIK
jgi:mannose-6-phosphate isomerase